MQITRSFEIRQPLPVVWEALSDVHLVAECLPGASLAEALGEDRYKGKFQVKVGPLAAAFNGEVAIERRPEAHTAVVSGKGTDVRSSSRASGTMTYRLEPVSVQATRVAVESTLQLVGALAQFGKAAVIQDIAGRITDRFAANLEARLAARQPETAAEAATPAPAAPLDAGSLLWSIIRARIAALLRRLFGRAPAEGRG